MLDLKESPVGIDFMSGGTLRDFFAQFMSQEFYSFFDAVGDIMFYGMITMAEPHAVGMARIPGIIRRNSHAFKFMGRHYGPIISETYKYRVSKKIRQTPILPDTLANLVDRSRRV